MRGGAGGIGREGQKCISFVLARLCGIDYGLWGSINLCCVLINNSSLPRFPGRRAPLLCPKINIRR